jgi:hypothetical protein
MPERITSRQFQESDGVDDWREVGIGACACFRTGSFAKGVGAGRRGRPLGGGPPVTALCPATRRVREMGRLSR